MQSKYDLIKHFAELGFTTGAEIGVAEGYLSEEMFKAIPNLKLYCVDIWTPYRGNQWSGSTARNEHHFKAASERLSKYNAIVMREMSMDAVKKFANGSLDFVYIDANHAFDYVIQDLIEWSKKVRVGGIISGDDYYDFRKAGVIPAVNAYTKAHEIKFNLTDPCSNKIKDREGFEQPSFYWTKT
jgi:phage-related protein